MDAKVKFVLMAFLVVAVMSAAIVDLSARTRTTRPEVGKKTSGKAVVVAAPLKCDTLCFPDTKEIVAIKGYNKPLRSRLESFFVTNTSDAPTDTIVAMVLTFNYVDKDSRQLHKTTHKINETIPPGETRQVTVPSWDRQLTYYYIHGKAGRTPRNVMPFDVAIRPDTVFVASNHQ